MLVKVYFLSFLFGRYLPVFCVPNRFKLHQVQDFRRIIAIHHMCVGCIMIFYVKTPSTSFYKLRGRVYIKDPID
jgi:hypothetical protein